MPRTNRPRRARGESDVAQEVDLQRALFGTLRTETRRDGVWNVQPVSPASAVKTYVCPGCGGDISPGQSHIVAWRADGLMGDAADIAARRHWHSHCWKVQ
ncbi:hypothetical protein BKA04_000695 [Cryobacterium mesophilum]|uniref:ATP/GTP-binding protein n=1 Tax=Terrimesophilobacter mesophilus TaxID=433647 RepID=A0A4R8VB25_9MICO|nr:hypothetical protein [Terrimesophilobacter mesophilus]MBB5632472.1 hypothetical protein [Terrimesophilobacter mesophilus]TFB79300.1 hypothetical protein E3N84_04065 [Terrimesophilobacter mesophilus]